MGPRASVLLLPGLIACAENPYVFGEVLAPADASSGDTAPFGDRTVAADARLDTMLDSGGLTSDTMLDAGPPTADGGAVCGNGLLEGNEVCDDNGNPASGFGCNDTCTGPVPPLCGDGVVNGSEVCDSNPSYCDQCARIIGSCGDGTVQTLVETCDTRGESTTCDRDCTAVICGDGVVNRAAGEVCDDRLNDGTPGGCVRDCSDYVAKSVDARFASCKALRASLPLSAAKSGIYWLKPATNAAYVAYCDLTTDGGGWTLVMRALESNFDYDSSFWSTSALDHAEDFDFVTPKTRSKYRAFNEVPFDELRTSDVGDLSRGYVVATKHASALALFGANGGEGIGVTVASGPGALLEYFDSRARHDVRQWGCRDAIHVGLNQRALLGIRSDDAHSLGPNRPFQCDWDGGARFGQRVNVCHYFSREAECGGDYVGQGWGNFWNRLPAAPIEPIRQLLWVR